MFRLLLLLLTLTGILKLCMKLFDVGLLFVPKLMVLFKLLVLFIPLRALLPRLLLLLSPLPVLMLVCSGMLLLGLIYLFFMFALTGYDLSREPLKASSFLARRGDPDVKLLLGLR